MKLLITTQKIDREDPVLGFFHRWVEEFAKRYEKVTVIALGIGHYSLPSNVEVFSLGKEKMMRKHTMIYHSMFIRVFYMYKFLSYIIRFRTEYDAVFVHMNPEYVVLGGIFWRIWGKRVALWYNHKKGGIRARVGALLSHVIFYVSPFAFMSRFKKAKKMGAGINTEQFKNPRIPKRSLVWGKQELRFKNQVPRILSLGRISPVKDVDIIVNVLLLLDKKDVLFGASIYGDPTDKDAVYYERIKKMAEPLVEKGVMTFHRGVPNEKTVEVYNSHDIFINMTPSGSFDKTILEAMACEMLVLTCNRSFEDILPEELLVKEKDSTGLAEKISHVLLLSKKEAEGLGRRLRDIAVSKHNLRTVIEDIGNYLQKAV